MTKKYKSILLLAIGLLFLGGCSTIREHEDHPLASLAVEYAAAKYVGESPERAERVIDVLEIVRARLDKEAAPVVLAELEQLVLGAVDWDRLDAADRLLAQRLFEYVLNELQREISEGTINSEDRMTIRRFLDLLERGARVGLIG